METNLSCQEGKKIIFVGGSPRSGTTMVQRILGAHSSIFAGHEYDIATYIVSLRNQLQNGRINSALSKQQIDRSICQLFESLLSPLIENNNCLFISEKTPSNILVFNELLTICPSAKFLFVIRDPRAIALSMKNVNKRGSQHLGKRMQGFTADIYESVFYINQCFNAGFQAKETLPDDVYIVKYESMTTNPKYEIENLCSYLKIPFEDQMLNPKDKSSATLENAKIDNIWYDTKMFDRNIDTSEIDKWKQELKKSEIFFINKVFKSNSNLSAFNYNFSNDHFDIITQFIGTIQYFLYQMRVLKKNRKTIRKKIKNKLFRNK